MSYTSKIPWERIHEFLIDNGKICEAKELCIQVIKKVYLLVPYDQARIYFVNDNEKIYDEVLFGVDKRWSKAYLEYFSKIENGRYGFLSKRDTGRNLIPNLSGSIYDWRTLEYDEFISDYIMPQGLHHSLGFGFHDANNFIKCFCTLDRTNRGEFTDAEIDVMSILYAHLYNLHKNLFVMTSNDYKYYHKLETQNALTKREAEIAQLISRATTPANISKRLHISLATVYKHIANIYAKLNVSSNQELLLKLMNFQFNIDRAE